MLGCRSRRGVEAPYRSWRRGRRWTQVFGAEELAGLCADHALIPEHLSPRIGPLGAMAKELYRPAQPLFTSMMYPLSVLLSQIDSSFNLLKYRSSLALLLVARKPAPVRDRNGQSASLPRADELLQVR